MPYASPHLFYQISNTAGKRLCRRVADPNKVQGMSSKATFAAVSLPLVILNGDAAATEHDDIPCTEAHTL